jgi:dienelactone hydrolase
MFPNEKKSNISDEDITVIPVFFETGKSGSIEQIRWIVYEPTISYERAVVIAYGSDGMTPKWEPEISRHAKSLAENGILALVPDYLAKKPSIEHGESSSVFLQVIQRHAEWEQVLRDAVLATKTLRNIDSNRVGLLGFSLGGFLTLRLRDTASAWVGYFSPFRFPSNLDLGNESPLMGLGASTNPACKMHIHHGENDGLVPRQLNADSIKETLEDEGNAVTYSYFAGANHGFQGADTSNTTARNKSFEQTVKFFSANL